jgi:hypothetical protein
LNQPDAPWENPAKAMTQANEVAIMRDSRRLQGLVFQLYTGRVAQLVEQRIENPRVGSSILPPATTLPFLAISDQIEPSFRVCVIISSSPFGLSTIRADPFKTMVIPLIESHRRMLTIWLSASMLNHDL